MKTLRLTTAEAIVRWLIAQRTIVDDVENPLFPGVFAIFGHGNVTSLGHALEHVTERPVAKIVRERTGEADGLVFFGDVERATELLED